MSSTTTSTKNDYDYTKVLIKCYLLSWQRTRLADTLSRAFLQDDNDLIEENFEVNTVHVIPMSDAKIMELKNETKKDNQLQQLISVLKSGWPTNKRDTPKACLPFRDKLSISDDIIFKGEKIIIPRKLQPEMLHHIHSSHLGIEKCKQ